LSEIQLKVLYLCSYGADDSKLRKIIREVSEKVWSSPATLASELKAEENIHQSYRIAFMSCDVIIFIFHAPSSGLGFELSFVTTLNIEKPILIFVRKPAGVESPFMRDLFFDLHDVRRYQIIYYDSLNELRRALISSLTTMSRLLKHKYYALRIEEDNLISILKKTIKTNVLVLGRDSDSEGLCRMNRIIKCLEKEGYTPVSLKNLPEIQHISLEGKMIRVGALTRFVIAEDSRPSGHIDEVNLCARCEYVTATVKEVGSASTWMQAHYPMIYRFMNRFCYLNGLSKSVRDSLCDNVYPTLEEGVKAAIKWAEECIKEQEKEYRRKLYSEFS